MRFPRGLIHSERNDKLCSENRYDFFATIRRIELGLKQAAAVYTPGSIQYDDSIQTVIQKSQDDSPHFRMWIDSLLNNDWIARCKDIMLVRSFKYSSTIAATKYDLQNKVANTKTSIFTEIAKGVKNSEN